MFFSEISFSMDCFKFKVFFLFLPIRLRQINNLQPATAILLAVGLLFENGSRGIDRFLRARSAGFWQFLDYVSRAEEGLHGIADRREFVFQTPLRLEFAGADGDIARPASTGCLDFGQNFVFDFLSCHWLIWLRREG